MPSAGVRAASCLGALFTLALSLPAQAECSRPDLLYALPADGATGVPTNAALRALYVKTAQWIDEEVIVHRSDDATPLAGAISFVGVEGLLTFKPDQPLSPGTEYVVEWPKLRGLNTASFGRTKTVTFRTGDVEDREAPSFDGLTELSWDFELDKDDCTETHEDRFVFELGIGKADDDSGRELLALVILQTAGPLLNPDGPEPLLLRSMPEPGEQVRVTQTISKAKGRVCFGATVRDSLEQFRAGPRVLCTETVEPPFFDGCAFVRHRALRSSGAFSALLLAGALCIRRRRLGDARRKRRSTSRPS